tara:strand:+ start:716 stop:1012 length:297 start_codon:yes stop_codon:yes gene_type:complete
MSANALRKVEDTESMNEEQKKEHYVVNYLKSLFALEAAIEPYKEQKKDLRTEYIDNGWLTREEIWSAVKAYRLFKKAADMDDLNDMFDIIEKQFGEEK